MSSRSHRLAALAVVASLLQGCAAGQYPEWNAVRGLAGRYGSYLPANPKLGLDYGYGQLASGGRLGSRYPLEPLRGIWTGAYTCGGESHDLKLIVFEPKPTPRSLAIAGPMTSQGRAIFEVRGSIDRDNGAIRITPHDELTHPAGFRRVSWEGSIQPDGSFDGYAVGAGCGNLHLNRVADPSNPNFQRAETNQLQFRQQLVQQEFQVAEANQPPSWFDNLILKPLGACVLVTCPGVDFAGVIGMGGAASGGGGSSATDGADRVREQRRGAGQSVESAPAAPTPFPTFMGDGPGYGINH